MKYQKKDLFTEKCIPENERTPIEINDEYPPRILTWKAEQIFFLGESNKDDLLVRTNFIDEAVKQVFESKSEKQFLYANDVAELFEVFLIRVGTQAYIVAIKTRRKT